MKTMEYAPGALAVARSPVRDWAAFARKAMASDFAYQRRDAQPSVEDIKKTLDGIGEAFESFKKKNDERLKQIEEKGSADVVTRDELEKVQGDLQALGEVKKDLEEVQRRMARPGGGGKPRDHSPEQEEHKTAFLAFLRNPDSEQAKAAAQEAERKWLAAKAAESPAGRRAVDTITAGAGGHAVPEIISRNIERELAEISPLRNIVDVQQAGSKDFKILVDVRGATYGWVGETDPRTETGTPGLEEVAPTFGMIYAYPRASEESLDDVFFNVEQWLQNAILEGFAEGEENAIVNGNGTKKPTGFLTGTPTAQEDGTRAFGVLQYIASGAAAAFTDTDKITDVVYSLKKGYRGNARWLMNKLTVAHVMKFKDSDGDYLWRPGLQLGQPDRLLAYPVAESEEMPDIAANAFPVAFGDFRAGYVMADLVGFRLTRDEITTPGYIKWYARRRLGGKIKKSEAIKLLKIAAT